MAHPLNMAIAFQLLNDIRNGQLRSCLAMGFSEDNLKDLMEPRCMSILVNAAVPWFNVVVDNLVVQRLLIQAKGADEDQLIMKAIEVGASSVLIYQLFGLSPKEVALRRALLNMPNRKGRWPALSQDQERQLWDLWVTYSKETPMDFRDDRALLSIAIRLTEEMPTINLTMVWNMIKSWIEQDLV